jgi:hypothetical protein
LLRHTTHRQKKNINVTIEKLEKKHGDRHAKPVSVSIIRFWPRQSESVSEKLTHVRVLAVQLENGPSYTGKRRKSGPCFLRLCSKTKLLSSKTKLLSSKTKLLSSKTKLLSCKTNTTQGLGLHFRTPSHWPRRVKEVSLCVQQQDYRYRYNKKSTTQRKQRAPRRAAGGQVLAIFFTWCKKKPFLCCIKKMKKDLEQNMCKIAMRVSARLSELKMAGR